MCQAKPAVETISRDFSIVWRQANGKPLVCLNNAPSAQKPQIVRTAPGLPGGNVCAEWPRSVDQYRRGPNQIVILDLFDKEVGNSRSADDPVPPI